MDKLAETLVYDHRNPIVKIKSLGTQKKCLPASPEENHEITSALNDLKTCLIANRVEKRCGRSRAKWLHKKKLAEVTKVVGSLLQHFGNQNKKGIFLSPEETLLLLETNRLELVWNDVPMSLQQAYSVILDDNTCSLEKYKIYRKLMLQGFVMKQKINPDESVQSKPKRLRLDKSTSEMADVFTRIKAKGPKVCDLNYNEEVDYKIYSTRSSSSLKGSSFNLQIRSDKMIPSNFSCQSENVQNILCVPVQDTIVNYMLSVINLPDL